MVSEGKLTEKALIQSESQAAILQSALDCVVTIDADGRVIYINPAAESTFGYSSDQAVGRIMSELIIPAHLRRYYDEGLAGYLATGHSTLLGKRIEVSGMRSDGSEIPLELTITAIGELPRPSFTAFIRDLTERKRSEAERKQSEEELRKSEERYRIMVENAHDIIYEHDLEGKYTSINKAGEQIIGYTLEETLKLNIADTVSPEHANKVRQMIAAKLAGQTITAYELEVIAKDGRRIPVEVNTSLVYQDGIPIGVQGIARDVTERKQLEEQLRQSQKMEAVGQLAGGVAHDFNNLLTVIGGYSSILLAKLPHDSPFRASVEEIKKASDRASGLTRQLLAFSRKQILQPRILDLNTVVSDLDKMLRRLIGEHIDLLTITDPSLYKVKADPGQIEQVLLNLVVNARDAMSKGGKLTIETSNAVISKDYAQLHGIPAGPYIMLAVSDTGCGMDAATREHIFEPFFTTKEAGKGTGLGLAMLYGIVKQSGGNVWVYSELGHGTTFKVYLPRAEDFAESGELDGTRHTPQGTETVLLVEDEEQVRAILKQILENQGYHVLPASHGEEALAISQEPGDIQLMITDVVMPQMSGRELAERIMSVRPSLRVLFMSGYTDDAIVRHGLLDEKLNYIQKPFDSATVARKVRDVLDSPG
jgi:two-component system cell cycle sensor histidine kinase/response regulator CckA